MQEAKPVSHPAFQFIRSEPVPSLNLNVEEYEHIKTGARHFHLSADNEENVFLVALRTVRPCVEVYRDRWDFTLGSAMLRDLDETIASLEAHHK